MAMYSSNLNLVGIGRRACPVCLEQIDNIDMPSSDGCIKRQHLPRLVGIGPVLDQQRNRVLITPTHGKE